MCDFISWIEKNGVLHYLTDAEIFEDGKLSPRLEGCRDNDIIGHGAIRKYYAIQAGKEFETKKFWEKGALPNELEKKVKKFDKFWGKTFASGKYFQNDDLYYIICNAPESWKAKAWEQLIAQKPSNDDLRYIICYAPESWKAKASEQLIAQKPSKHDLRHIIYYAPESWKAKASEQLIAQKPSNDDLHYIIYYAPESWKAKAWEQLLTQKPSNDDLRHIICYAPESWKAKARKILEANS
jgi:hypothetical protein